MIRKDITSFITECYDKLGLSCAKLMVWFNYRVSNKIDLREAKKKKTYQTLDIVQTSDDPPPPGRYGRKSLDAQTCFRPNHPPSPYRSFLTQKV